MRDQHVPTELTPTEADIRGALLSIGVVMPVVCKALGFSEARSLVLMNLVQADYETYMLPALLRASAPKGATVKELVGAGHVGRSGVYETLRPLIDDLHDCAMAIPILLEARGDFVRNTAWCAVEVASPVGKAAKGPGIVGGSQHLFGLALVGGDMCLPASLSIPEDEMDERRLNVAIRKMLERAESVAARLREYACAEPHALLELGVDPERLAVHQIPGTLLVPQLHVGPADSHDRWPTPVRPNSGALWEMLRPLPIKRLVVESADDFLEEPQAWDRVSPRLIEQLLAFVMQMGLNTAVRPSEVTYALRFDGLVLYRHDHLSASRGSHPEIAQGMSFDLAGFETDVDSTRALAEALGYVEFLATNENLSKCSKRFGRLHAPARIKAPNGRPLLCGARMIGNDLLVSQARDRQAQEFVL